MLFFGAPKKELLHLWRVFDWVAVEELKFR